MPNNQTITRRTITVLVCLIGAMTIGSGLLLLLEPGPVSMTRVPLAAIEPVHPIDDEIGYIPQDVDLQRWTAIVIHDSRSSAGSAASLDQLHRNLGLDSLAYHFVIGNGRGAADGAVQQGTRWKNQLDGAHTLGDSAMAKWYNHRAIGICVIGSGDNQAPTDEQMANLTELVRKLQETYQIPVNQVEIRFGGDSQTPNTARFPMAAFFAHLDRLVGTR